MIGATGDDRGAVPEQCRGIQAGPALGELCRPDAAGKALPTDPRKDQRSDRQSRAAGQRHPVSTAKPMTSCVSDVSTFRIDLRV